jgi:hypothetical protein
MSNEKRLAKFDLKLTRAELLHLRDLMGVSVPNEGGPRTVSSTLAAVEGRKHADESLWEKISTACQVAQIALEDDAPDYIIAPIASPPMAVFRLQEDEDLVEVPVEESEEKDDGEKVQSGSDLVRGAEQADESVSLPDSGRADEKDVERKQRRLSGGNRKRK